MDFITWGILACTIIIAALHLYKSDKDKEAQITGQKEVIEKLKDLVTGGDGYVYLKPARVIGQNRVLPLLSFEGDNPIYDVTVSIEEFNLVSIPGPKETFQYQKTKQESIQLGTVNPLRQKLIRELTLPNVPTQFGKRFFLSISARNTLIEEDIYLRIEGEHYSEAYKVVTFSPDYERTPTGNIGIRAIQRRVRHVDPTFPVHELDHINGDSGWIGDYEQSTGTALQATAEPPRQTQNEQ